MRWIGARFQLTHFFWFSFLLFPNKGGFAVEQHEFHQNLGDNSTLNTTSSTERNNEKMRQYWQEQSGNIWSLNSRTALIECDFDNPKPCSALVQSNEDDADWRIRLVNSSSDNSQTNFSGHLEAQAGPWIRPGTRIRIKSTQLLPPSSGYCLRFTYRFVGQNIGALTVGILDQFFHANNNNPMHGESSMRRIWFKAGPILPEWFFANVSFSSHHSFKIIFEALLLGPNNPGSIAIDTISLQQDYCLDFVDTDIVVNPNALSASADHRQYFDSPTSSDPANTNWLPLDSADSLWPGGIVPYEIDSAFCKLLCYMNIYLFMTLSSIQLMKIL